MMSTMVNGLSSNNLALLKKHIEETDAFDKNSSEIEYKYSTVMNIYDEKGDKVNPNTVFSTLFGEDSTSSSYQTASAFSNTEVWNRLFDNKEFLENQYEVVDGQQRLTTLSIIVSELKKSSRFRG